MTLVRLEGAILLRILDRIMKTIILKSTANPYGKRTYANLIGRILDDLSVFYHGVTGCIQNSSKIAFKSKDILENP